MAINWRRSFGLDDPSDEQAEREAVSLGRIGIPPLNVALSGRLHRGAISRPNVTHPRPIIAGCFISIQILRNDCFPIYTLVVAQSGDLAVFRFSRVPVKYEMRR